MNPKTESILKRFFKRRPELEQSLLFYAWDYETKADRRELKSWLK